MDMEEMEIWLEIAKQLQAEYRHICEIRRLTEEMREAFQRDDTVSVQLILGMRQEEMNEYDRCEEKIHILDCCFQGGKQERERWLKSEKSLVDENEMKRKSAELYHSIQSQLKLTMEIDKRLNKKIAGEDSFYKK